MVAQLYKRMAALATYYFYLFSHLWDYKDFQCSTCTATGQWSVRALMIQMPLIVGVYIRYGIQSAHIL